MKSLRDRVSSTRQSTKYILDNFDGRYACNICGTPIEIKVVPKKSTYFYNLCCPSCNLVLTGTNAGRKDTLFPTAMREGYIRPIDK